MTLLPEMALSRVVETAAAVAAHAGRKAKSELLAELLRDCPADSVPIVVGLLIGEIRQGRIGVGWSTMASVDVDSVIEPTLMVTELDRTLTELAATSGAGSNARRLELLAAVLGRATTDEADFVRAVLTGGLRQGALAGVMVDAIAKANAIPARVVRRATMLSGDLGGVGRLAATGGRTALDAVGLQLLRGVQPMLAATSPTASDAVAELGLCVVQTKLDGVRIQAHRRGDEVALFTRNLNDVTQRLPDVVSLLKAMEADTLVLDGEVIGVAEDSPELFQDTASTFSSSGSSERVQLKVEFFDILHRDGVDLIDLALTERLAHLDSVARGHTVDGIVTADGAEADRFAAAAVDAGHEGVLVKAVDSPYAAGRRGKTWRKVKPVHTFDLVVLGVEWGHGRRNGWLSNLHLGARDSSTTEGTPTFVMVGKTFKGLTDELLAWQTEALLERETHREGITVFVAPELVIEIALDGVQRSTTYPGGLALRFARVKRYRPDRDAASANTLDDLRALFR